MMACKARLFGDGDAPEPSHAFQQVDADHADWILTVKEKFREMVGFELVGMVGVVDTETPSVLEQDDATNVMVCVPLFGARRRCKLVIHDKRVRIRRHWC